MAYPQSSNLAAFAAALKNGNVGVDVYGDSTIAGQPSDSGQDWDNLFYGLLRQWSITDLRGFSTDIWLDSGQYTPSPDQSGSVTHPVGTHNKRKPNSINTWSTSGADETGVLGMLNGLQINGQASSGNQNLVLVEWTVADLPSGPIKDILQSSAVKGSAIFHHHTDGMQGQLQIIGGASPVGETINTASGSGITKSSITANADLSSATAIDFRFRQRSVPDGDQSGNYGRLGQMILEDQNVTGCTLTGCGIGGVGIRDIANELGDSPAGLCDDADFNAYRAATGATAAIVQVGRNDSGETGNNINAWMDDYLGRLATAGYTHILVLGIPKDGSISAGNTDKVNQSMYDAVNDHSTASASFLSMYTATGSAQLDASYLESGPHYTKAGADYLAGVIMEQLQQAGGARQRLRRRGRRRSYSTL